MPASLYGFPLYRPEDCVINGAVSNILDVRWNECATIRQMRRIFSRSSVQHVLISYCRYRSSNKRPASYLSICNNVIEHRSMHSECGNKVTRPTQIHIGVLQFRVIQPFNQAKALLKLIYTESRSWWDICCWRRYRWR